MADINEILEGGEGDEALNLAELDEKDVLGDDDEEHHNGVAGGRQEVDDLYDEAMAPSGAINEKRESAEVISSLPNAVQQKSYTVASVKTEQGVASSNGSQSGKRYCCYIGNMTWWTTDDQLQKQIQVLGIDDLVDIKFYENRNNGQSKGFALAVFATEPSVKTLMEKLPSKKLHDQSLVVLPYTKQSLAKLEDATKRYDQKVPKEEKVVNIGTVRIGANGAPVPQLMSSINLAQQLTRPVSQAAIQQHQPTSLLSLNFAPPPISTRPPPTASAPAVGIASAPPPAGINTAAPPPTMSMAGAGMMAYPPHQQQPRQMQQMPGQQMMGQPQAAPGFPPGAHINPQVYPGFVGGYADNVGGGVMSEAEFQEVMNRNQTVSSSAIHRAVSDAGSGDYASAIETLVTAISLIRQSRVANDDRCKLLVNTLQDTLRGIEAQSYSGGGIVSRKHRARDRSRSPVRSSKRYRRSRSRSRSRDYSPMRYASMTRRY